MKNRRTFSDFLFLIIILFLAFATFISYHRIIKLNDDSNLLAHTTRIKYKLAQALTFFREVENRQQYGIHAREKNFNITFEKDSVLAFQKLHELNSLVLPEMDQQARVDQLKKIAQKFFYNLKSENDKAGQLSDDLSFYSLQSQTILNKIQQLIVEMRHVEDDLLLQKLQEKDRSAFFTPVYSMLLSFLAILIVTVAYFRLRNETYRRRQAEYGQAIIHNFFQQAPAMLAILKGPKHVFEFANPPFLELIGGRNPINKPVREAVPEAAGQGYFEILDSVYQTGNSFVGKEMPLQVDRGRGAENIFINFICQVIKNESFSADRILVFCYEVSELVRARNQLQEAENRSRLAIEATRMGTFDWNLKNQEFISTPRLDELFGSGTGQNITHQDMLARIHPDDRQMRDEAVRSSFATGSLNYELRVIWPDRTVHWISVYGKIFSDEASNTSRMYGSAVDITSVKIALQELKESEANLETKVFERTQSLNYANLALTQTVQQLEQTNSELASFNYIASHDLQEPLRKIIAFSKRIGDLEQNRLSEPSQDYFNRIVQAAYRMQNLIDAFLSYSQASNIRSVFELMDFNMVFSEVKNEFQETLELKNISLESQPLPVLLGIPMQINQLFTNIIGNAIKYIRQGTDPKIEVNAEETGGKNLSFEGVDPDMKYWKISIRDNGIGFDQMYESQIFELFQRLHSRQEYAGTGIGLAICKKIMRNHNGFISASGEMGSGAVFFMYFPALSEG
jgi:signal transduction histidine kinase